MTKDDLQKRINQDIEEYLNTYQVMLEYGRLLLDKDKSIRDSYRWIAMARKGLFASAMIEIILWIVNHFLSAEVLEKYMPIIITLLTLSILAYVFLFYYHRKKLANLLLKDDKKELMRQLDDLQSFLNQLYKWLKTIAYGMSPTMDLLNEIKDGLSVAQSKQDANTNRISVIQGELDPELDQKAHEIATKRLEPYKKLFYPYE